MCVHGFISDDRFTNYNLRTTFAGKSLFRSSITKSLFLTSDWVHAVVESTFHIILYPVEVPGSLANYGSVVDVSLDETI